MYKILIIDDEAIIRRGLKNIIDWESLDCVVCDEAGNGVEAIDKVKTHMPDIIIVDIKMPGMNGIELIKAVKDIVKKCKIIILSGYRDFEYMQSAIKLGAFDYILKPSKVNDIVDVVKRAVGKIKEENQKEHEINKLRDDAESSIKALQNKFLYELLVTEEVNKEEIEKERSICGLEINGYRVITVRIFNVDNDSENFRIQGISELFKESFESIGSILSSELSRDKFVYIVQYEESTEQDNEIEKKLDEFIKQVNEYYSFKIYAGISEYGNGLFELNNRLNESLMDLNLKKSDIGYKDIKEEKKDMKESKVISLSIRKTLDYINEHYSQNITLNDMAEYNGISPYYLSRLFTKETGKNFVDYVNEVRIKKAKELLREDNYKYYEIAEMVGINDSHYFSKIFKKYTGITPSEYKREKC